MAGQVATEANAKQLVLVHAAPYYLKVGDPVAEAKESFKGDVSLAKDLDSYIV
jgi:ribonuclease BN (tRNA processing enzyme)